MNLIRQASLLITLLFSLFFSAGSYAQGTWVPLTTAAPDYNSGVMMLMTDGTVLCKTSRGGGSGTGWDKLTPDIHGSYVNGTWTRIASTTYDRLYFSTQVLLDGRLYVAGGEYGAGGVRTEVYNPVTNTWLQAPQIVTNTSSKISDANSGLLPDGTVLQSVVDTGVNAIYYPATNTYSFTATCLRWDNEAPWVKLPDNTILFQDNYGTTSERYNPVTHTWINDGVLPGSSIFDPYGSEAGGAFLLPNGKVWFIGSSPLSAYYTPSGTTSPGVWTVGPPIPNNQGAPDACASIMPNGKILLCLSPTPTSANHFPDSTTFYEFDYTTNTYTMVGAPGTTRDTLEMPTYYTNMLSLPDGTILYASQGDDQYYEYVPSGAPLAAGKPTINSITRQNCNTYQFTGTLFNGITEGASYGDDWQMETNFPIVQLSSGTNVYYAKTTNWNRPGAVMTGALLDTATFTVPTTVPYGTYAVKVIVNGIPSDPFTINTSPIGIMPSATVMCSGLTTMFVDTLAGGTWSIAPLTVGTISSTGIVTGVASGTATISYAIGSCASTAVVSVNATPSAISPAALNICMGASAAVSDAVPFYTWSSDAPGVATIISTGTTTALVTSVSVGTTVISYTSPNGCAAVETVTVNPLPFGIAGSLNTCVNATTSLSDPSIGGTWLSGNMAVGTIGASSGIAGGLSTGTSIITYTLPTGCSTNSALVVNSFPTTIMGALTVCEGVSSALSDGVPGGTWASSNTAVAAVGSGTGSLTGLLAGTSVITYTLGGSCTVTGVAVVLHTPGAITGTPNTCTGSTTTLGDPDFGGTWTSLSGIISVGSGSGDVSGLSTGTATIYYTIADGCTATTQFTVNPTPGAISGPGNVCDGTSITLTDGLTGGSWISGTMSVAVIGSGSGILSGVSMGTTMVTYMLPTSCSVSTPVIVNTTAAPISGSLALCLGSSTTLSDPTPGGSWLSSNTTVASIGTGSGIVIGTVIGTTIITYSLGTSCSATAVLEVKPLPSPISGATTFCSSSSSLLSDVVTGGTWSSGDLLVATVGSSSGTVSGVAEGTAIITYAPGAGCYITTVVTSKLSPTTILGTTAVCLSGTSALSDGVTGGTWLSGTTSVATIGFGSGTVSGVSTGTSIITYTLSTGCSITTPVSVAPPTAAAITGSSSVCPGQTIPLADATSGGVWTSSNVLVAAIGTGGVVTGGVHGTSMITYTVTTACGVATARKVITVNANPVVSAISGSGTSVCTGATLTLFDPTTSGVWTSGSIPTATVGSTTGVVSGITPGLVTISYTVTNISGCSASAVQNISVTTPMAAAITPIGSTTFCTGGSVLLQGNTGTGLAYQWKLGGVDIAGATNSGYVTGTGGNYTLSLNSGSGCVSTSPTVTVTVNPSPIVVPVVNVAATPGTVLCLVTAPVTFSATSIHGGLSPVYNWYLNGSFVGAGTSYANPGPLSGDIIKCVLTSNDGCAFPDTAVSNTTMTISPNQTPAVTISANPGTTLCTRESVTLSAMPVYGGTAPTYTWNRNGTNVATGSSFIYTPADGDVIKCTMVSNFACLLTGAAVSSPVTLHVIAPYTNSANITVSQSTIGSGQSDTFTVTTAHGGTMPAYQWFLNGAPVPGATSATYVTTALTDGEIVTCEVTSNDPCATPHTIMTGGITVHVGATGISTVSYNAGFILEPNPNKGTFTISGSVNSSADQLVNVTVTDMLGKAVYKNSFRVNSDAFSSEVQLATGIANGMYLVNVTSGANHVVFHMVVDK